jgi:hypothetical protein
MTGYERGAIMLMQEPTLEMIERWKSIWMENKDHLRPNRKAGSEIVDYITKNYPAVKRAGDNAMATVMEGVLLNERFSEKLPAGKNPSPAAFAIENTGRGKYLYEQQDEIFKDTEIFVVVDMESGYFHVEGSSFLWDALYAYRGLDEMDIQNFYCVAEYISCLEKLSSRKKADL